MIGPTSFNYHSDNFSNFCLHDAVISSVVINEENVQLKIGKGFDHNYCVDGYDGKNLLEVAQVKSEKTGIGQKFRKSADVNIISVPSKLNFLGTL